MFRKRKRSYLQWHQNVPSSRLTLSSSPNLYLHTKSPTSSSRKQCTVRGIHRFLNACIWSVDFRSLHSSASLSRWWFAKLIAVLSIFSLPFRLDHLAVIVCSDLAWSLFLFLATAAAVCWHTTSDEFDGQTRDHRRVSSCSPCRGHRQFGIPRQISAARYQSSRFTTALAP
jgi:hypothetical protein